MSVDALDVIDSHVHFWDVERLDYPWLATQDAQLRRTHVPSDYARASSTLAASRVVGVVAVQADAAPGSNIAEAFWFQELADDGAPIVGIVAAAALERGVACAEELSALTRLPLVAGVRRLIQDEAPGFATSEEFVSGVRLLADFGLTMDLCVREHQLAEVTDLARRCPEVMFVLDHLGKPTIDGANFRAWARDLSRLAELPNVSCKLSGLMTEAAPKDRNARALEPWLFHALDSFGTDRCMYGTDWPVLASVSRSDQWLEAVDNALSGVVGHARTLVMAGNARRTYQSAIRARGN